MKSRTYRPIKPQGPYPSLKARHGQACSSGGVPHKLDPLDFGEDNKGWGRSNDVYLL